MSEPNVTPAGLPWPSEARPDLVSDVSRRLASQRVRPVPLHGRGLAPKSIGSLPHRRDHFSGASGKRAPVSLRPTAIRKLLRSFGCH